MLSLDLVSSSCHNILPLVKFAYNNVLSTTIGVSSFFANKKYHPNIIIHPKCNIVSSWAYNFTIDLNKLQSTLKVEISVV